MLLFFAINMIKLTYMRTNIWISGIWLHNNLNFYLCLKNNFSFISVVVRKIISCFLYTYSSLIVSITINEYTTGLNTCNILPLEIGVRFDTSILMLILAFASVIDKHLEKWNCCITLLWHQSTFECLTRFTPQAHCKLILLFIIIFKANQPTLQS